MFVTQMDIRKTFIRIQMYYLFLKSISNYEEAEIPRQIISHKKESYCVSKTKLLLII